MPWISISEFLNTEIGIKAGETTKDWKFRLETSGCIGSCRQTLALTVNGNMHRHVEI